MNKLKVYTHNLSTTFYLLFSPLLLQPPCKHMEELFQLFFQLTRQLYSSLEVQIFTNILLSLFLSFPLSLSLLVSQERCFTCSTQHSSHLCNGSLARESVNDFNLVTCELYMIIYIYLSPSLPLSTSRLLKACVK